MVEFAGIAAMSAEQGTSSRNRRSVNWKLMPVFVVAIVLVGAATWLIVPQTIRNGVEADAVAAATRTVQQFQQVRAYYTANVVGKALKSGVSANFDHKAQAGTIPLPATMLHDLSAELSKDGTRISLYSPYPFPNRKDRSIDAFGREAWEALSKSPDQPFKRVETIDGKTTVRVGVADRLTAQACVDCHNVRADSPKKDWKLGDMRGVLEVAVAIDQPLARAQSLGLALTLGAVAVLALVNLAIVWILRRVVLRPIGAMTGAMSRLARRDWSAAVPGVGRGDEIGAMAAAVQIFKDSGIEHERLQGEAEAARRRGEEQEQERQRMQQDMHRAEAERKLEAEHAARKAEELRRAEEDRLRTEGEAERRRELARLAGDFEQRVKSVVQAVTADAERSQQASGTMARMAEDANRRATSVSGASRQASDNVQAVAASAEELAASIREISHQVADSSARTQGAVGAAERAGSTAEGLAAAAQKIGEVVQLINSIASQTNLLALNATIEAARAGEAGKGFAVVASEVKSLANQTAKATDDIVRQVQAIQHATSEVLTAVKDVTGAIGAANEIAGAIAAAVEEQGAATQEISRNVAQAAKGTDDVTVHVAGVSEAAGNSRQAANDMQQASTGLLAQSRRLGDEVEAFLRQVRAG
jgi:methyl-accepting chemotaxis protein